jgi:hypothetical protein
MDSGISSIAEEKLKKAVAEAVAHLYEAMGALPFLVSLTSDQRMHSGGKLKHGEEVALDAVITTMARHPGAFASLKLDPTAMSEQLSRRALLQPLATLTAQFAERVSDTMLYVSGAVHESVSAAYRLGSVLAGHDQAIATDLQPAQQFYQSLGRASARSRKARHPAPQP